MNKFIFDVDGTLTPSRQRMSGDFQNFFLDFCYANDVYLITGSDNPKTVEQVGEDVAMAAKRIYNCSGNDVWEAGVNVHTNEWKLPEDAHEWLSNILTQSQFSLRTGMHFEHRPGMCNFSIVGRNATQEQRKMYVGWDTSQNERDEISKEFNYLFPELEARPGGETGIDIAPLGLDKSQIIKDFEPEDVLHFFGDRMDKAGNDYPLKKVIIDNDLGMCYNINSWTETFKLLEEIHYD